MPLVGFICPNGNKVSFEYCIHKCKNRCISIPTAIMLSHTRGWNGIPSVTQLLKDTREAYLEILHNYYQEPSSMTYALLGTAIHERLEEHNNDRFISEKRIFIDIDGVVISGRIDVYDKETKELWDYKTTSEYAVILAKQGKKWEWNLQLNMYKIMLEELGYEVRDLFIQYILKVSEKETPMGTIKLPIIDKNRVLSYFKKQAMALLTALKDQVLPPMCRDVYTWNGKKCKEYCPVRDICRELKEGF